MIASPPSVPELNIGAFRVAVILCAQQNKVHPTPQVKARTPTLGLRTTYQRGNLGQSDKSPG